MPNLKNKVTNITKNLKNAAKQTNPAKRADHVGAAVGANQKSDRALFSVPRKVLDVRVEVAGDVKPVPDNPDQTENGTPTAGDKVENATERARNPSN